MAITINIYKKEIKGKKKIIYTKKEAKKIKSDNFIESNRKSPIL